LGSHVPFVPRSASHAPGVRHAKDEEALPLIGRANLRRLEQSSLNLETQPL
jgi:hypothetical protein